MIEGCLNVREVYCTVSPGSKDTAAISDAIVLALKLHSPVTFDFNGRRMIADPQQLVASVVPVNNN